MSYLTGTVVGTPATLATDFYQNYVRPQLAAHAAWQFVEDYNGDASYNLHVWKLLAASSGAPNDVYFTFADQKTSGTALYMFGHETYNPATHQYTHRTLDTASNTSATNANGCFDDVAYTLGLTTGGSWPGYKSVTVSGLSGTYDYWIIVTTYGIYIGTRVAASLYAMFAGVCDSLIPTPATNDPFPMFIAGLAEGGSAGWGHMTRMPMVGAKPAFSQPWHISGPSVSNPSTIWTPSTALNAVSTALPDLYQGAPTASRLAMVVYAGYANGRPDLYGNVRGLFKADMLYLTQGPGATMGDTVTIGGQTYVNIGGQHLWVNTQAT